MANVSVRTIQVGDTDTCYITLNPEYVIGTGTPSPVFTNSNFCTALFVKQQLDAKQNTLHFDSSPRQYSTNPVTSEGIYNAIQNKQDKLVFDSTPTLNSNRPVTSNGIALAINNKQNKLTFDNTPQQGSNNPVRSSGIYNALQTKQNTLQFEETPTNNSTKMLNSGSIYMALGNRSLITWDSIPTINSFSAITSGAIYTALGNKSAWEWETTPTASSNKIVTSGGIYNALSQKQNTLTFDTTPRQSSSNPVTSDGIYSALQNKQDNLIFDEIPNWNSTHPVTSRGIEQALANLDYQKQDKLTFDTVPTESSNNPVTSDGIYSRCILAKQNLIDENHKLAINLINDVGFNEKLTSNTEKNYWNNKQDALIYDSVPTQFSSNIVNSNGIFNALRNKQDAFTVFDIPTGSVAQYIGFDANDSLVKDPSGGGGGGGGGTSDYDELSNKPIIYQSATMVIGPIVDGQDVEQHEILYIDSSKDVEASGFVNSFWDLIPGFSGVSILGGTESFIIYAVDFDVIGEPGASGKAILFGNLSTETGSVLYATESGSFGPFGSFHSGFNITDSYQLSLATEVETFELDTAIDSYWNGVFVSINTYSYSPNPQINHYYRHQDDGLIYLYSSENKYEQLGTQKDIKYWLDHSNKVEYKTITLTTYIDYEAQIVKLPWQRLAEFIETHHVLDFSWRGYAKGNYITFVCNNFREYASGIYDCSVVQAIHYRISDTAYTGTITVDFQIDKDSSSGVHLNGGYVIGYEDTPWSTYDTNFSRLYASFFTDAAIKVHYLE